MKLRKQLRWLYHSLQDQIQNVLEDHNHATFHIKGNGCMLCRLLETTYTLATLQLARENGIIKNWIPAELEMADLLGHEVFKKRLQREVTLVKNLPRKVCGYCDSTVIFFSKLSNIAKQLIGGKHSTWFAMCQECGHKVPCTKEDIPAKLQNVVRKRLAARKKRHKWKVMKGAIEYGLPQPPLAEILAEYNPSSN